MQQSRRNRRYSDSHDPADRIVTWLSHRIYNDREVDAGILMVVLGLWIGLFHVNSSPHPSWREVFSILPAYVWLPMLSLTGAMRLVFAKFKRGRLLAATALASTFEFAFMGFLVTLVDWRMTVCPLFFWCAYQALKSHIRIIITDRSQGPDLA